LIVAVPETLRERGYDLGHLVGRELCKRWLLSDDLLSHMLLAGAFWRCTGGQCLLQRQEREFAAFERERTVLCQLEQEVDHTGMAKLAHGSKDWHQLFSLPLSKLGA